MTASVPDPLLDDLKRALGDAYTIERELTGGGMSRVFVAREHALGREVVIKVLPPDLAAGVNRDRFRREVQLAARLSHPYIVPLLHAGEHGSLLWFTMPYIAGESLRTRLQREQTLKVPDVLRLLHDVVEALAYAHSRGVVHRDIKPANILSDGQHALVTDFGVAKALNAALPAGGPGHTTSGMAIGTPAYMAPEQLAADPDADQRVDIYAVGLLAYELLSGASPFAAASPTATMTAQLTRIPPPLHTLRPDVPEALSALIQHCLAKSPEDRPASADVVLHELDRISGALMADVHRSTSGETTRQQRASALPLVLATVGVLALVAGGFWWTGRHSAPVPRADSTRSHVSGDTNESAQLPTQKLTHQDSLAIASVMRDQLTQLNTHTPRKRDVTSDALPGDISVHTLDSLVQARVNAIYKQSQLPAAALTPPATATPGVMSAIPGTVRPFSTHRLTILTTPSRGGDTTGRTLAIALATELARRAQLTSEWTSVTVDTQGFRGNPRDRSAPNPDVVLFVSLRQGAGDSTRAYIGIRGAAAPGDDQSEYIVSDPVLRPTSPRAFGRALRDASSLLSRVAVLPPGMAWPQINPPNTPNVPNAAGHGPGPSDRGFVELRGLKGRSFDSLHRFADSLRRTIPPRRRDSL
jgi:serine/threonine protein kinase